jgi:putative phosphoribosyl transferase
MTMAPKWQSSCLFLIAGVSIMNHLPFENRLEAGRLLASELYGRITLGNAIVLGMARGGVPVAFAVASQLGLPLDVVVARKLGVPWQPELAMGALAGTAWILNERMIDELGITAADVEKVFAREQAEMKRREFLYRAGKAALDLEEKTAILVDDGLATGSTMRAAIRHARNLNAKRVIAAAPVGSRDAVERLRDEADEVVCPAIPAFFSAVGEWYRDFQQVSDDEVRGFLAEKQRPPKETVGSGTA